MPQRYYYTYQRVTPSPRRPPQRHRSSRRPILLIAIAVGIGIIIFCIVSIRHAATNTTEAGQVVRTEAATRIRQAIANDKDDRIGVALENVTTGALTTYGSTAPFVAASTEKVLSATAYYHLVEKGLLSLDDQLGAYSAAFQMNEMINISDNDSWQLINNAVGGGDELSAYAALIGMSYDATDNSMRPQDMALLLSKLYTGKLIDDEHRTQLLGYMQHTNDETMIPSVVPASLTLYHKYGQLTNELHDAALISDGTTTYALVIYTTGSSSVATRTAIITHIASAILEQCGWSS